MAVGRHKLIEAGVRTDARISRCGTYRWWLSRIWDVYRPTVCWVMLNPSTADAEQDDPTIRRCVGFARDWGAGGIHVVNLFALRSTDPRALRTHTDPVGGSNDRHVLRLAAGGRHCVVAAWGNDGALYRRGAEVRRMLRRAGVPVMCLGVTRQGEPKHPLYVRADQLLIDFK